MPGDFDARDGQQPLERILGTHGKNVLNENWENFKKNFTVFNELEITVHF
jgi:hypothetical protein